MRPGACILLLVFAACATRAAGAFTNFSVSLSVPPAWVKLTPEQVQALRAWPEAVQLPVHGALEIYRPEAHTNSFTPPWIFVRESRDGRVHDLAMRMLIRTNDARALREILWGAGLGNGAMHRLSFDTNEFVIEADASAERGDARDRMFLRLFFTEHGVATVTALSSEADFPQWSAMFRHILDSARVAEPARYQLREFDLSSGARDWFLVGGALGVLLAVVGGWTWWSRRGGSTLKY